MPAGWFDAFRENGAPTWYGENRTPVVTDTETAAIAVIFGLLFIAFLLIFPGVRRERSSSFIAVTLNLLTGAVILVCLHHPCWEQGCVHVVAPYRSFSSERINAYLGLKVGLSAVNITLTGAVEGRHHSNFSYNERFVFTEVRSMQEELRKGLKKGLPYPILSAIQYLSVDKAGFSWGRAYRLAGYYTSCLLWLCFAVWLLGLVLMCLVPHAYPPCLFGLGSGMCLSVFVYRLSSPAGFRIPFPLGASYEPSMLVPYLNWCFWLTLANGLLCLIVGATLWLCDRRKIYKFATFFQVDLDDMLSNSDSQFDYRQLAGNGLGHGGSNNRNNSILPGEGSQHVVSSTQMAYSAKNYSAVMLPMSDRVAGVELGTDYSNYGDDRKPRKRHQLSARNHLDDSAHHPASFPDRLAGSSESINDSDGESVSDAPLSMKPDLAPQLDTESPRPYSSVPAGMDRKPKQHRKLRSRRATKSSLGMPGERSCSTVTNLGPLCTGSTGPSGVQNCDLADDNCVIDKFKCGVGVSANDCATDVENGGVKMCTIDDRLHQRNAGSHFADSRGSRVASDSHRAKRKSNNNGALLSKPTGRHSYSQADESLPQTFARNVLDISSGSAYVSALEPRESSQNCAVSPPAPLALSTSKEGADSFNEGMQMNLSAEARNFHERFPVSNSSADLHQNAGHPSQVAEQPEAREFRLQDLSNIGSETGVRYVNSGDQELVNTARYNSGRLSNPECSARL